MQTGDRNVLDGRLIGELRNTSRQRKLDDLLLDGIEPTTELDHRVESAERELDELRRRVHRVERGLRPKTPHHAASHTLFAPSGAGYEIVEADGPPPRAGDPVVVGGRGYHVLRVGRSPFPSDRRPCVFLVPA